MTSSLDRPAVFIRHRFQHMGAHSGYDQLVDPLVELAHQAHSVFLNQTQPPAWAQRILTSACYRIYATPFYKRENLWAELRALSWRPLTKKLVHVLYAEDSLGILARFPRSFGTKIIATVHQPFDWWTQNGLAAARLLDGIDAVVALSRREAAAFGNATRTPVHFVPHGVDVDFFSPSLTGMAGVANHALPRCLFVGNWLRDFRMLHHVVERLSHSEIGIQFDLVTPEKADRSEEDAAMLKALVARPNVRWHRGVDDDGLRQLYRDAWLLLMPLRDSTANNAVLEAMACGLPIVTNQTSGIADYTEPDYSVVVDAGDAEAMASAAMQIICTPGLREAMAMAARQHAVTDFAWPRIAARIHGIYAQLA